MDPGGSRAGEGGKRGGAPERRLCQATLTRPLPTGNVVNGMIARQMVDMLVESSSNVEMILKFFDMFLKLKDIVGSEAFQDYVTDPRGLISKKDFQKVSAGRQGGVQVAVLPCLAACLGQDFSVSLSFFTRKMGITPSLGLS